MKLSTGEYPTKVHSEAWDIRSQVSKGLVVLNRAGGGDPDSFLDAFDDCC